MAIHCARLVSNSNEVRDNPWEQILELTSLEIATKLELVLNKYARIAESVSSPWFAWFLELFPSLVLPNIIYCIVIEGNSRILSSILVLSVLSN